MPGFDKKGPVGEGPVTGRGFGPCGWGLAGRGIFGWRRGGRIFGGWLGGWGRGGRREDLEAYKSELKEELERVEEELKKES
jgi:hypothetical protein